MPQLKHLPSISRLQQHPSTKNLMQKYDLDLLAITPFIKDELESVRTLIKQNKTSEIDLKGTRFFETFFAKIDAALSRYFSLGVKPVINATGTVLHTNLGRSRLSARAISAIEQVAKNYSTVEYDLNTGQRGIRHQTIEELICQVTNAEAAMITNNNAAAVYLVLNVLAKNKEVIVSRGELIEIGGSFRVSAIMEESGAILKEVGSTNKTHLRDYEKAINENTAILMKVHTSNFRIIGFTEDVPSEKLFLLAKEKELISYEDLGSGGLFDFAKIKIGTDKTVQQVIKNGADLVSFSGDKLLGGPQAGIIVGKKSLIKKLKTHQLARVVRVDKLTIAALEATLLEYERGIKNVMQEIPTIRDIITPETVIEKRAKQFKKELIELGSQIKISERKDFSTIGGGSLPTVVAPTLLIGISIPNITADKLHKKMRQSKFAIIGIIKNNTYWLDLRTVTQPETTLIITALKKILKAY